MLKFKKFKFQMPKKRLTGLILLVAGVVLIITSLYIRGRVDQARGDMNAVSGSFKKNPFSDFAEGAVEHSLAKYQPIIRLTMVGGLGLLVAGSLVFLMAARKRR